MVQFSQIGSDFVVNVCSTLTESFLVHGLLPGHVLCVFFNARTTFFTLENRNRSACKNNIFEDFVSEIAPVFHLKVLFFCLRFFLTFTKIVLQYYLACNGKLVYKKYIPVDNCAKLFLMKGCTLVQFL